MDTRFRELFEAAPDAILEVDHEGGIRLANEEAERIFGCPRSELIGRRVEELLPERYREMHLAHRGNYQDHPVKRPMGSGLDLWARKADGTEFPVDIKLSPIQTEDGLRIMCVVRDITERRKTEAQIRSLNENLERRNREVERANQLKSEFLASMSHEFRTPLNAIIGFSDLLREESAGSLNDDQKRFVAHISQGSRHLRALINDILDLSKIEAGRLELQLEHFPLQATIEEAVAGVRASAEAKGLSIESRAPSAMEICADRTRFKQILYNLLSNAVKFTPDGGAITVEAQADGDVFSVSVADTGIGIPQEEIESIFESFHQAAATTKGIREGTGLGLAITRRLVELHRGRIWVESEPGRGSRFVVELPVRASGKAINLNQRRTQTTRRPHRPVVLVIEDDETTRELLMGYLEPQGYDVAWARSGVEAIRKARQVAPDAITLDLLLPGGNGWETLHRLKTDPFTTTIPVLVISALDERGMGLTLGASEYLVKPIEREVLLRTLRKYVSSSSGAAKILVVDDDTETRYLLAAILDAEGYVSLLAASGSEALDILSRIRPGAILLDLLMPGMDGFEVFHRLKEDRLLRDIPVFVLTGKDLTEQDLDLLSGKTRGLFLKRSEWKRALVDQLRLAMREDPA